MKKITLPDWLKRDACVQVSWPGGRADVLARVESIAVTPVRVWVQLKAPGRFFPNAFILEGDQLVEYRLRLSQLEEPHATAIPV